MKKLSYLIPILFPLTVEAQAYTDSLWIETVSHHNTLSFDNPIFLSDRKDSVNIGNSEISYFKKENHFRDAYSPKEIEGFNIKSERFVSLKNWKFYGLFSFSKHDDIASRYTEMADPYRDNPYKVTDAVTEVDWRKQHYFLQTKIVSPYINEYLRGGIGIKYEVLNGARQKDPRPLDKTINIELTPSIMLYLGSKFKLGFNGYYNRYMQDFSMSLENHRNPQEIYKMTGIGEYLYNGPIISTSLSRMYRGNTFGGGVGIGLDIKNNHKLRAIFSYKNHKEDVTDGVSTPFKAGRYTYHNYDIRLAYSIESEKINHFFDLYGRYRWVSDYEFIQRLDNITQQYKVIYFSKKHSREINQFSINYNLFIKSKYKETRWNFQAGIDIYDLYDRYPSTQSKDWISNLLSHIGIKRWFSVDKGSLSVRYSGAYRINLNQSYVYNNKSFSANFIADKIAYPNHLYNMTNYLSNLVEVQYNFNLFKKTKSKLYIKTSYENILANRAREKKLNNHYFAFTIGLYN